MNYIVFDLEWNQCPYGKIMENEHLPFEIVEIGAIKLNEDKEIIDEFRRVIRPSVYKKLHFRTKDIICMDMDSLNEGIRFHQAAGEFIEWCGENPKFCTWGSLDLMELQRNMKYYCMMGLLKGPIYYYDVQKLFSIAYEDGKSRSSLQNAVDFLDIDKTREFHSALGDAYYTAKVLQSIEDSCMKVNYSIDCYQNPKSKRQEIYEVFEDSSKYISREFESKEEAMRDRKVTSTKCFVCKRSLKRSVKWFSVNTKIHYCLAYCPKHGYFKGKIRMKKTDEGKYYVVKTMKHVDEEGAQEIRDKQELLRVKRQLKRQKNK